MTNIIRKKRLWTFGAFLALSGCGLTATDYVRPDIAVPGQWQQDSTPRVAVPQWWKQFGDEKLNALVDEALAKNNNLAAAAFKVKAAQLKAGKAFDQFLPDVSAQGTAARAQSLRGAQAITRGYDASVDMSYEVDLWGKIAAQSDEAAWEATATEQDRQSTALALTGSVVSLYWKIAYLNERIALSQQSIDYLHKTLDLVRARHGAGLDSALDEVAAERDLATQQAAHTQYVQQRVETLSAFAILFDAPPETAKADPQALPVGTLPQLAADAPASLLDRRPDLRAAEYRLRKSLSGVDATRASYLPSFSLTGSLGSSSVALTKVLSDPVGTLGAGVVLPFLNWFDMKNDIAVSETEYEQAVTDFRQTLYTALAEVENALSARRQDAEQGDKLAVALAKARKSEELYALRYKEGYAPLQDWLDAQEKRRTTEASALENRYTQIGGIVTLYKALGGDAP